MYRAKCSLLQIPALDQCVLATQVLQDVRCEIHSFAILGIYINIPKLLRICPESAYSPKKRSTNQQGNRSHSKDTFMRPPKAPLTIQIDARSLPKTVPNLSLAHLSLQSDARSIPKTALSCYPKEFKVKIGKVAASTNAFDSFDASNLPEFRLKLLQRKKVTLSPSRITLESRTHA